MRRIGSLFKFIFLFLQVPYVLFMLGIVALVMFIDWITSRGKKKK